MVLENLAVARGGGVEIAFQPRPRRGDVAALAVVGAVRQGLRGLDAAAQLRFDRFLVGAGVDAGLEAVADDEIGIPGQRPVDLKSGLSGKRRLVRVDLVGRRYIKK